MALRQGKAFWIQGKPVVPAKAGTSDLASNLVSLEEILEVQFGGRMPLPCPSKTVKSIH